MSWRARKGNLLFNKWHSNLSKCSKTFHHQDTLDLRGEGAGARDSRTGGAAGALALLPDEVAGEPSQSDQHLQHGTGEPG